MCKETTHANRSTPEHQMLHTMKVEQTLANMARRALKSLTPEQTEEVMYHAHEALLLGDTFVTPECSRLLHLVEEGDLATASRLR